jgi:hypothetical protein
VFGWWVMTLSSGVVLWLRCSVYLYIICIHVCMYKYRYLWVWLQNDISQWHIAFYIASGVYFSFNLFFVLFGKAEIQPWNDPDASSK